MKFEFKQMSEKMSKLNISIKRLEENNENLKELIEKSKVKGILKRNSEKIFTEKTKNSIPTIVKIPEEEENEKEEEEKKKFEEKSKKLSKSAEILKSKASALFILTFGTIKHAKTFKEEGRINEKCLAVKGNSCITCDEKIRVWDMITGKTTLILKTDDDLVVCLIIFQNWIVVSTKSKMIKIFHFVTGELTKKYFYLIHFFLFLFIYFFFIFIFVLFFFF